MGSLEKFMFALQLSMATKPISTFCLAGMGNQTKTGLNHSHGDRQKSENEWHFRPSTKLINLTVWAHSLTKNYDCNRGAHCTCAWNSTVPHWATNFKFVNVSDLFGVMTWLLIWSTRSIWEQKLFSIVLAVSDKTYVDLSIGYCQVSHGKT